MVVTCRAKRATNSPQIHRAIARASGLNQGIHNCVLISLLLGFCSPLGQQLHCSLKQVVKVPNSLAMPESWKDMHTHFLLGGDVNLQLYVAGLCLCTLGVISLTNDYRGSF